MKNFTQAQQEYEDKLLNPPVEEEDYDSYEASYWAEINRQIDEERWENYLYG